MLPSRRSGTGSVRESRENSRGTRPRGRTDGGWTVDFYVRDFPGLVRLSVAAARAFRSPALMAGAEEARFSVDLEALVGAPGSAEVTVEELLDESGEGEEMFSGTVLESCRQISVEFSRRTEAEAPGQGRSIGRKLFQRLVALDTPMVYAVHDAEALAAEFSPENGVRDFTPPVDITDESLKAESVLSSPVPRPSPGKPGPTAANVSFRVSSFGRLVIFEPLEGDGGASTRPDHRTQVLPGGDRTGRERGGGGGRLPVRRRTRRAGGRPPSE